MPKEHASALKGGCPACGQQPLERRTIRDEFDYGPENERLRIVAEEVPVLACPACDEIFYGPEAEQAHHRAICQALGLLTPEQIREVRERLGLSQGKFAELTGIGVATLSRWEKGRLLQTRSLDNYLHILNALPESIQVLERLQKRAGQPVDPWRCLKPTDVIRARRVRFCFHPSGADPVATEPEASADGAAAPVEAVNT